MSPSPRESNQNRRDRQRAVEDATLAYGLSLLRGVGLFLATVALGLVVELVLNEQVGASIMILAAVIGAVCLLARSVAFVSTANQGTARSSKLVAAQRVALAQGLVMSAFVTGSVVVGVLVSAPAGGVMLGLFLAVVLVREMQLWVRRRRLSRL